MDQATDRRTAGAGGKLRISGDKQLQNWLKRAEGLSQSRRTQSIADTKGLYIRLHTSGSQDWLFRYTFGKSRVILFGHYPELSLAGARIEATKARVLLDQGKDPAEVRRAQVAEQVAAVQSRANTVAYLANEWLDTDIRGQIASDARVEATVQSYIIDRVGSRPAVEFNGGEVKKLLRWVRDNAGPSVSNNVLRYVRRIYNQAARDQMPSINFNPTAGLRLKDAGGTEQTRERVLSDKELVSLFKRMHGSESFGRQNEISVHLILRIGNRKMELLGSRWAEFDLDAGEWLPQYQDPSVGKRKTSRKKNRPAVPLPPTALRLLKEQRILSGGRDYVFPTRRVSKRRRFPHISPDTLNSALNDLNGETVHFTVHDLRRTARTLMAKFGVIDEVAELCIGHGIKGVKGVYNRYKYFEERRAALMLLESHYNKLLETAKVESWL